MFVRAWIEAQPAVPGLKQASIGLFYIVERQPATGQGIDMVGCHDGVITNNTLQDTPGAGVQGKGGTADVLIHANTFTRVAGRGVP